MSSRRVLAFIVVGAFGISASVGTILLSLWPHALPTLADAAHAVAYTCTAVWSDLTRAQVGGAVLGATLGALLLVWLGARLAHLHFSKIPQRFLPLPASLLRAATQSGLPLDRIRLIAADQAFAMTVGWWQPTIVVSTRALQQLTPVALEAVLQHETHHLQQREPLRRLLLAWALACVPLRSLRNRLRATYITASELEADGQVRDQRVLGTAILQLVSPPPPAVGFSPLDARVERLLNPSFRLPTRMAASFAGIAAVLLLAVALVVPRTVAAVYQDQQSATLSQHVSVCREAHERATQSREQTCGPQNTLRSCATPSQP